MTDTADHITIRLRGPSDLERLNQGVRFVAGKVGEGWSVVFTRKRSVEQNARLWAVLARIAKAQPVYCGVQMDTEDYKDLFVHAYNGATRLVPGLDGKGIVALRQRSSKLSVEQFSELFALIEAWAAENNIELGETE
jgi:hypothetical protein